MSAIGRLASSQSRTTTTTPARAIKSTLLTRSSSSVPPASRTFEPFVKSILSHRLLYNIFAYSLLFSWIQTALWVAWSRGGISFGRILLTPVLPATLALACLNWAIGALPIIILRKIELTAIRTSAPSPSQILRTAMPKRSTLRAFLVYTISATLLMTVHILMATALESGNPRLTVFVQSKKYPYYLNGRFLFLLLSQITLSCGLLLRNILLDRFVFRWSLAPSSSIKSWPFRMSDLITASFTIFLFTYICIFVSGFFFSITRIILPLVFKLPVLPFVLQPFTAHFLRGSWTVFLPVFHFSLMTRTFFLSLTTISALEFAELLFDSFVVQPIVIARTTADPFLTAISGITSSDVCIKYFAYSELSTLANDQSPTGSARRTALFADTKFTPILWSQLLREALLFLGRDYQLFLGRGKLPTVSAPPTAPAAAPVQAAPPGTPTQLIKKPIYKPTQPSPVRAVLDSFAADGSFSRAVETSVDATHIPEIFKSVENILRPAPPAVAIVRTQTVGLTTRLKNMRNDFIRGLMVRYVPASVLEVSNRWTSWWRRERVNKKVDACLPHREVDVLIIDIISHLTCASLTEDTYGVVQRDIPQILEALLSFLSAVETYQREISALYTPPLPNEPGSKERERVRVEVEKGSEIIGLVGEALKEGVARIVRTFGDRLLAFKFPLRIAIKLQSFVDYTVV